MADVNVTTKSNVKLPVPELKLTLSLFVIIQPELFAVLNDKHNLLVSYVVPDNVPLLLNPLKSNQELPEPGYDFGFVASKWTTKPLVTIGCETLYIPIINMFVL